MRDNARIHNVNALQVRIPEREERKAGEKHVLSKHHGKRHST